MKTFIYALRDPRDGRVRYVGKANRPGTRLCNHISGAKPGTRKHRWLSELKIIGLRPSVVVLEEVTIEAWENAERRWIAKMRAEYPDLLNVCSGGNGLTTHSAETRSLLRKLTIGRTPPSRLGKKLSPETLERVAKANRARVLSAEGKSRIIAGRRPITDEGRAKVSAALRLRVASAATREKLSAANRARSSELLDKIADHNRTPEKRALVSAANLGRPLSSEHRDKIRAAMFARYARLRAEKEVPRASS